MIFFITRHGETVWNVNNRTQGTQDVELTEKGLEQAKLLAQRLVHEKIDCIYTSDLKRAFITADIIGKKLGINLYRSPLLREACFGIWEGYSIKEIERKFPGQLELWYKDFSYSPKGGESVSQVRDRIRMFIKSLKSKQFYNNQSILVVSHALTSKILILELMEMPITFLKNIKQSNTALSIIEISDSSKKIITLNDTCHLSCQTKKPE